jgi:hypothetical protein
MPKEETAKQVEHAIEITLKKPEWMKLSPPEPVTIEYEPNADPEASD